MDTKELENLLSASPVQSIFAFDTISSTNDFGLQKLSAYADTPDWTLVIAETQTAGRGRLNRKWVTEPGAGLAFSLVLRLNDFEKEHAALFSPWAAVAVAETLADGYGLQPAIKWPNDVLLGGRKTCGILAETSWLGEEMQGVVVGIGVNIRPASIPPPEKVLFPATCIENEAGRHVERLYLLREIILALGKWRSRLGTPEFYAAWEGRLAFRGEWVRIERPGVDPLLGIVAGIAMDGCLRLQVEQGGETLVSVGDVRLRPLGNS